MFCRSQNFLSALPAFWKICLSLCSALIATTAVSSLITRSRPYRKNDNCFVEQKNGDLVRKTVGYARFEGEKALQAELRRRAALLNPVVLKRQMEAWTVSRRRVYEIIEAARYICAQKMKAGRSFWLDAALRHPNPARG